MASSILFLSNAVRMACSSVVKLDADDAVEGVAGVFEAAKRCFGTSTRSHAATPDLKDHIMTVTGFSACVIVACGARNWGSVVILSVV